MLSLFALRGARLFFKPPSRTLRSIGGYGNNMRESGGDHRRLSLLIIVSHFRVTHTGIANGTVPRHCVLPFAYGQTQPASCTLFSNITVGKEFEYNT